MPRNYCKQKNKRNKKIKFSQNLLDVKECTNVEGPTNCQAATSIIIIVTITIIIIIIIIIILYNNNNFIKKLT